MAETPFVESKIYGFFEPTFVPTGRVSMRIEDVVPLALLGITPTGLPPTSSPCASTPTSAGTTTPR